MCNCGRNSGVLDIDDERDSGEPDVVNRKAESNNTGDREVWFLVFDRFQTLDLTGPLDVFGGANQLLHSAGAALQPYELKIVSRTEQVQSESGLTIVASALPDPVQPPHTLIIPGGRGVHAAAKDPILLDWVRQLAASGTRISTVCTGTFLAGAADLLDDQHVTTHWASVQELREAYPRCRVDGDALYLRADNLWSSAGVTAGVDLALALLEDDLGADVAQEVARWLVVYLRRPGGQTQFAPPVWNSQAESSPIRNAQDLINTDPSADLSIETLAGLVGMSSRHFSRRFTDEVGLPPGRYIEAIRVTAARHHLERSDESVERISKRCGFASAEVLRRAFHRQVGTSPDGYRKHHALPATTSASTPPHSRSTTNKLRSS